MTATTRYTALPCIGLALREPLYAVLGDAYELNTRNATPVKVPARPALPPRVPSTGPAARLSEARR